MNGFVSSLKAYASRNIGLAFYLAWNYIALYGCAMAIGIFIDYNLEYIWIFAGLAELICALIGLAIARKGLMCSMRIWGVVGAACAVLGNATLWISYAIIELYWTTFAFAGVLMGVGIVIMGAIWGSRLALCDSSKIEFDVLASFALAFALYCVTLPIKLYGVVNLIVASILPIASMYFAFKASRNTAPDSIESIVHNLARQPKDIFSELRKSASTFAVVAVLWTLIAYFRVILAPLAADNRYQHYLFPFLGAFIITIVLFIVFVKFARYVSITLSFRWAIPFILLGLGVVFLDPANLDNYVVAYSMNYIGMFGVQISCLIAMSKYLHREKPSSHLTVIFGFLASQGFGIVVGCGLGLFVAIELADSRFALSLAVLSAGVFVIMLMGFNPHWRLDDRRHRVLHDYDQANIQEELSGGAASELKQERGSLSLTLHRKASLIQKEYGLTERETEIAELLLAGRTRPYIRDELVISLNTVHSHASNIFSKCQIHSQQDLIDLAYRDEPNDDTEPGTKTVGC